MYPHERYLRMLKRLAAVRDEFRHDGGEDAQRVARALGPVIDDAVEAHRKMTGGKHGLHREA